MAFAKQLRTDNQERTTLDVEPRQEQVTRILRVGCMVHPHGEDSEERQTISHLLLPVRAAARARR